MKDYSKNETSEEKIFAKHVADKELYTEYIYIQNIESSQNSTRRKQINQLSKWTKG